MSDQAARASAFHALHIKGNPVILFNIWDAGSAAAVEKAGAKALATGSRSVAGALGFDDGHALPMALALENAARIVTSTSLPVTMDFEGAYATKPADVAANTKAALATGVIGINFEDQIVGGDGLYSLSEQSARIGAMRGACDQAHVPAFINARTDLFLKAPASAHDQALVDQAIERAIAYQKAGASGFFIPGLGDLSLITQICSKSPLPVNVMVFAGIASNQDLAKAGVARISYGPGPWRDVNRFIEEKARQAMAS